MRTAQEYLREKGLKNPSIDSGISGGGSAPRVRVSDAMKDYAKEVAKQALANASESALIKYNEHFGTRTIDKQSILNESNIPKL